MIRGKVRDPDVGVVTVTGVDVTPDLWLARVYVDIMGDAAEQQRSIEGLTRAAPFLRTTLSRELRIRRMPELRFLLDRSLSTGQRIEELLASVLPEGEGDADGESASFDAASDASSNGPGVDEAQAKDESEE